MNPGPYSKNIREILYKNIKVKIQSFRTEVKSRLIFSWDKVAFNNILFPFSLKNSPYALDSDSN